MWIMTTTEGFTIKIWGSHTGVVEDSSFGMLCCVICYIVTNLLKDCSAIIFRVKLIAFIFRFKLDTEDEGSVIIGDC